MRLTALLLAVLVLAGCERPLIDTIAPRIEVLGPDLSEVQTTAALALGFRVADATALMVGGRAATFDGGAQTFRSSLTLQRGLNRIALQASDDAGVIATDTLRVVFLGLESRQEATFGLPTPRTEAAAVAVQGRVLVTGGIGETQTALASMAILTAQGPRFTGVDQPLLTRRAGHTASVMPDGSVLLVGGSAVETPQRAEDFVATVEVIRPGALVSEAVSLPNGAPRRTGHTVRALRAGDRTFVYLYGGLAPVGDGVTPSATVDVFEWDGDALRRLTPDGGAGQFTAQTGHIQVPLLPSTGATGRAEDLVAGPEARFQFVYTARGGQYPFDVEAPAAASDGLADAAAAPMNLAGLAFVAGGRAAGGTLSTSPTVYALDGRALLAFRTTGAARLIVPRTGAAATLLPDGRILVAGGRTGSGSVTSTTELFSY